MQVGWLQVERCVSNEIYQNRGAREPEIKTSPAPLTLRQPMAHATEERVRSSYYDVSVHNMLMGIQ